ncbi:hypothetical protein GWA97_06460 [Flavobacterium sp. LaA7.5]|nr:hypothetical protein [Flavobacterium salilacus subsp. altitudinum]
MKANKYIFILVVLIGTTMYSQTGFLFNTVFKVNNDGNSEEEFIEYFIDVRNHNIRIENKVTKDISLKYCNYIKTEYESEVIKKEYYKSISDKEIVYEVKSIGENVVSITYYNTIKNLKETHLTEWALNILSKNNNTNKP